MPKFTAGPEKAMSTPASAGPPSRIALIAKEFRAIAFIRSSCGTVFETSACRTGPTSD